MNKILMALIVACTFIFSGCDKELPTADKMESSAYSIGTSAALVANLTTITDENRANVIDLVTEIQKYTPVNGEGLATAWTKIVDTYIETNVTSEKMSAEQANVVRTTINVLINSADYIINKKWPSLVEYEDLLAAASRGICEGFLTNFKPANVLSAASPEYDKDAYDYLMNSSK